MSFGTRAEVYAAIDGEREYQRNRWGAVGAYHEPAAWITFMQEYLDRARVAVTEGNHEDAMHAIRKVAALGVAAMENQGVYSRAQEEGPEASE
jgi:hypothetical protein